MSKGTKPVMKTNQTFLEKMLPPRLGKLIAATLMKLKNAWSSGSYQTGIQFFGEMDD